MTFTLPNWVNFAESGGLGAPGAPPVGATITVNSVLTPQGHKAFAVLRAPLDFVRIGVPADAAARTRQITVTTSFQAGGGAPVAGNLQLVLERPPVVLCHGLWSNPATWNNFAPLIGNPLWDFQRVDYSNNNAGPFAINRFQVRRNATTARDAKKRRGIASAQVDWVGHSMGGLLPRSWVRSGFFRRPDNFGMGDLHKLVTLNTPHWGSPMANLLVSLRGIPVVGDYLIVGMERMGMSIVGGAVDNLAEGSAALAAIGVTPVRSHSIAGKGGSEAIGVADVGLGIAATLSPPPFNGLFRLLNVISFATTATLYRFQEHDFIVLLPSQIGGLFGATTTTHGGFGSHHTAVTSYAPAANTCIAQLNARVGGGTFAPAIPAPNLAPPFTDNPPTARQPAPPGQGIGFPYGADTFHELFTFGSAFDLQGQRIRMARTANGYMVTRSPGTIVPPTASATIIANGDDVEQTVPLSTAIPVPGGATTAITVSSNGLVALSAVGSGTSYWPNASALENFAATTLAASWQDLNPAASGSGKILFEEVGGVAYVTWDGVYNHGTNWPNRFQVQLQLATGDVDVVYGATTSGFDSLAGFSVGGASTPTPGFDLSNLNVPLPLFDTPPPTVTPGAPVTIDVTTFGGYAPASVLFLASGSVFAEDTTPPFAVTLTVPTDAIGDFQVIAIAVDAQDRVAFAGPLAMPVNLTATLTGLSTFSERIQLGAVGETANLTVMGDFSDGVQRNVGRPGLGTTFSSSNANIATIDPDGVITAVGEGVCTVVAQNGGYQVSVGVFVRYEADLAIVGEGCAASTGVPTLGATGVPTLGNSSFRLTATGIAVPSFTIFALQGGPALAVGVPIPGAPACALGHVLPSVTVASLTDPSGIANLPLPIPATPALAGAVVSAQVAVWDPALVGYALPIGTSAAMQVTIGH
jgi:pimeloyl-ACP methyl ester carboxylesterase